MYEPPRLLTARSHQQEVLGCDGINVGERCDDRCNVTAGSVVVPEQLPTGLVEQELAMAGFGGCRRTGCTDEVVVGKVIGIAGPQRDA